MQTIKSWLEIAVLATIVVFGLATTWQMVGRSGPGGAAPSNTSSAHVPNEPIDVASSASEGLDTASTTLIVFSEFQCPFCAKFAMETMPIIRRTHVNSGQLRVVFKHYPLVGAHPLAFRAAEVAECSKSQGGFWRMHDLIFSSIRTFGQTDPASMATSIGLNGEALTTCLSSPDADAIKADMRLAETLGVTGTPTFFLGRTEDDGKVRVVERFAGAKPIEYFNAALDRVLPK